VSISRVRPPAIPFRRTSLDGFPVAILRREANPTVHASVMHTHRFFSLSYADGGSGALTLPGQHVPIAAGDVHLIPPGEPHDTSGMRAVTGWVLEFTADVLGEQEAVWMSGIFGPRCGRPRWFALFRGDRFRVPKITVPEPLRPRIAARFRAVAAELAERPLAYQDAVRAELQLLLVDLSRIAAPANVPAKLAPLVDEVFAVIDARYTELLSLRHVARAVGRSPSHVTNLIREQTGLTGLEWILERRLDEARRRLRDTDEDVAIVAERVGFGCVNHFMRQFRKAHGISPRAWRKSLVVGDADKSVDRTNARAVKTTERSPRESGRHEALPKS
jgi:AraC-like DNA-binding protein